MPPVRVVLVEDNEVFRDALELLLGMRERRRGRRVGRRRRRRRGRGARAPARTSCSMDYRLPALDGIQATAQVARARARASRVVALTASADERRARGAPRGGRSRLPRQGPGARRDRRARSSRRPSRREPHRREHRDRPRLDRRPARRGRPLPELARRAAVRPLRRRELPRRRRHLAGRVLRTAARPTPSSRRTSQPTPGDFLACYHELDRVRADLLAPRLGEGLRHVRERGDAPPRSSGTASCTRSTPRRRRRRSRCSRSRSSAGSSAARPTRRSTRSSSATGASAGCCSPSTRSSSCSAAAGSARRRRSPATLLHVKPILSIVDGEVEPVKRVRGERKAFAELVAAIETETRTSRRRLGRARRRAGAGGRARGAVRERLDAELELVVRSAR